MPWREQAIFYLFSGVQLSSLQSPFLGTQLWLLQSPPALEVPVPPLPQLPGWQGEAGQAGSHRVGKSPGWGNSATRLKPACFACLTNLNGHPLRPLGRSGCGTSLRMTGWWHPVGAGGGGGVKAGSPKQGGAGGLKIAAAGFQLANVEAGSWRRGGWQAVFAHSAGLCFPWVPGVSHGGASEEVLALHLPTLPHTRGGMQASFRGARGCAFHFQACQAVFWTRGVVCSRGRNMPS